ncbi:MAG: ABC transporter substrate-binding protein, partial [Anaerolineae bacterium]|nr:ABC transporter substrate-binding protein [Anaerolineae bacterium]MCB0240640.1 ABC transporter substrate-binding protein [Anaerolineae bacterium]
VLFEGYDSATTDFAPFINKIEQSAPDAILGGGHFQDGSTFARQLAEKGVDVPYMALLVAPPEPTFADLGDAAVGVVGPSQWEPLAKFTEAAASSAGLTWVGPTGDTFVSDYQAAYNDEPSYHAAGGYVAGMMLGEAIKQAGSLDSAAVKAALDSMDLLTFYGHL